MNLEHARRLFRTVGMLSLPVLAGLWLTTRAGSYEAWGYPVLGIYMVGFVAVLTWSSIPVKRVMSVSHAVVSIFWLGLLTSRLFAGMESTLVAERVTPDVYLVFVLITIVAYLTFSTPTALNASVGLLLVATVVVGVRFASAVLNEGSVAAVAHIWMYEAILGITILMLHALARSKDRYAAVLLEAARLHDLAYTDTLTSLPNRRELEERLEFTAAAANELKQPLSVVFFDLDDFKSVNDAHGHAVGDDVLTQVGEVLQTLLRSEDTFGRWGGEEYLVVAPRTSHVRARELAERLRLGMEAHEFMHGIRVTASFGVATSEGEADARTLLSQADERLYRAKHAGRNRVVGGNGAPAGGASGLRSRSSER